MRGRVGVRVGVGFRVRVGVKARVSGRVRVRRSPRAGDRDPRDEL